MLLKELVPTLDEDMDDLDEYEMGMQFGKEKSRYESNRTIK